jgi:hypothetical protein
VDDGTGRILRPFLYSLIPVPAVVVIVTVPVTVTIIIPVTIMSVLIFIFPGIAILVIGIVRAMYITATHRKCQ